MSVADTVGVDAVAVTVNATIDSPIGAGYMTAYPCGSPVPDTSNLNFVGGEDVANLVTIGVGDNDTISLYDYLYPPDRCHPCDCRCGRLVRPPANNSQQWYPHVCSTPASAKAAGWCWRGPDNDFAVGGDAGIPTTSTAAILNVTATGSDATGFITVYPCDQPRPDASNLNYPPGESLSNAVTVKLAATGTVCIYASSPVDILADLASYYLN